MISQSEIAALAASNVGLTPKEKAVSRDITARMLVHALEQNDRFYEFLGTLFPKIGTVVKSIDGHVEGCECCQVVHKVATFTPQGASSIDQVFRNSYPAQWQQLHNYANNWLQQLMSNNLPNQGAPLSQSYWEQLQHGANFGHNAATKDWKITGSTMPPMPYIVNAGDDFVKQIYTDGYALVSSQITLTALPLAMESINSQLAQGRTYDEITDDLQKQHGATTEHWKRLIVTEMAIAANAGTMAAARALNEPSTVIKWSVARGGNPCPICLNYGEHAPYELDQVPDMPHPRCKCARIITFKKRQRE